MNRKNARQYDQIRPIKITPHVNKYAEGSVIIELGDTKVLCTASVDEKVPPFLKGQGKGWITAEYSLLPRATHTRNYRESIKGKLTGRTMEIQRLIGRALRSVVNLSKLGERTITLDCDVLQADGGTRTASITGAFVAMTLAIEKIGFDAANFPVKDFLGAISAGVFSGDPILDLDYEEDSKAIVDMNIVMTGKGEFVELQGTGEEAPFSLLELQKLLELANIGVRQCVQAQKEALGAIGNKISG